MSKTLNVINSSSDQPQTLATGNVVLQQTDNSEALGLHTQDNADTAVADSNLMDFLKTEAAGSVHDSSFKTSSDHYLAWQVGLVILAIAMALILVSFLLRTKKQPTNKL